MGIPGLRGDIEQTECDQEVLRVVGRTRDIYEYRSLVAPRTRGGGQEVWRKYLTHWSHLEQREGGQDEFRLEQRGGGWEIKVHVCLLFQT